MNGAEDKGLVLRGLLLFALIGCIVAFVLVVLFWRTEAPRGEEVDLSHVAPSEPGWQVRYNAAAALARRGSAKTPWPILREMLDEKKQLRNTLEKRPDGTEATDPATAHTTMIAALRAIASWHEQHKSDAKLETPADRLDVYAMVDRIAENAHGEVKNQAEKARASFFR